MLYTQCVRRKRNFALTVDVWVILWQNNTSRKQLVTHVVRLDILPQPIGVNQLLRSGYNLSHYKDFISTRSTASNLKVASTRTCKKGINIW